MVRREGQTFPTLVTFAGEGEPNLLGAVTLQETLLAVHTVGQRLVPAGTDRRTSSATVVDSSVPALGKAHASSF